MVHHELLPHFPHHAFEVLADEIAFLLGGDLGSRLEAAVHEALEALKGAVPAPSSSSSSSSSSSPSSQW
jgi:hypothetical protein